ncbi:MAG: precorrin-2 C(20)-methyltransferase [Desulfobacterota bacterium]|nr:precorrin-2 C(20)-methyltransferase [Thermodesulfobacteriota bacterium]
MKNQPATTTTPVTTACGTCYLIGVGPGDPSLMTFKAAEVLRHADTVFIPRSGQERQSLAFRIAQALIPHGALLEELVIPMSTDRYVRDRAYDDHSRRIAAILREGRHVALLTLGDPGSYSSASQIVKFLKASHPTVAIEIIPGVTSFAAAAARAGLALAEGNEVLSIVSSYDRPERIEAVLDAADTVVFLKTYMRRNELATLLERKGLLAHAVYVSRVGLPGETVIRNICDVPDEPDYLSMIIVKKNT